MTRLVWIASYPKSGSSWLRIFLENLLNDAEHPVDINRPSEYQIGATRDWMDEIAGIETSDLTPEEMGRLRPRLYASAASGARELLFVKVHDAYSHNIDGAPLFAPDITHATVYIIRNPLDVCVSWANHFRVDIETAVRQISNDGFTIAIPTDRFISQVSQRLSSWSRHALSWVDAPGLNVHVMRYEDMKREPQDTFSRAVQAMQIPHRSEAIAKAIRFSCFNELRAQEARNGFRERSAGVEAFFARGQVGAWRGVLTPDQVNRIVAAHGKVMRRFAYLSPDGTRPA